MTLTKDLTRAVNSARTVILNNLAEAAELTGETNQYGDKTLLLDKKAEDEIIKIIHQLDTPMIILSEERGLIVPEGRPEYIAVIDPIDGSANIERGIPLCSIGISAIRHSEKMTTDDAEISIIESIFSDEIFIADMERGVRRNGKTIRVADPIPLERSIISYDTKKSRDERFLQLAEDKVTAAQGALDTFLGDKVDVDLPGPAQRPKRGDDWGGAKQY